MFFSLLLMALIAPHMFCRKKTTTFKWPELHQTECCLFGSGLLCSQACSFTLIDAGKVCLCRCLIDCEMTSGRTQHWQNKEASESYSNIRDVDKKRGHINMVIKSTGHMDHQNGMVCRLKCMLLFPGRNYFGCVIARTFFVLYTEDLCVFRGWEMTSQAMCNVFFQGQMYIQHRFVSP